MRKNTGNGNNTHTNISFQEDLIMTSQKFNLTVSLVCAIAFSVATLDVSPAAAQDEQGACCLQDGECIEGTDWYYCEVEKDGLWLGPGTTCSGIMEACCLEDGACVNADPLCCNALGGMPQGPGTGCIDMTIACCPDDGTCMDIDPICCDDFGGQPSPTGEAQCLGDLNGNNIDDACEEPAGACCFDDGFCVVLPQVDCAANGGTYEGDGISCDPNPCPQPECEPTPDGSACEPVMCPDFTEECQPRCMNYDPATGQHKVIDCECRNPDECYVAYVAVVSGPPGCVGSCPPGMVCDETRTTLADGTIDICCDCVQSQPRADYGDAPDPTFPSLLASGGPHHLNLNDCYVGPLPNTVNAEGDAQVPDLDADDGKPLIFASQAPDGTWTGWVYVPISINISGGAPQRDRYLNVLLDGNSSGTWCDQPGEWVVRNYPLWYWPTIYYCVGGFSWVGDYSGLHWLRVTVSEQKIAANVATGWDGRVPGAFQYGETEDWLLGWHYDPWIGPGVPGAPPPPHDPGNPPLPEPIPECNKTGTIHQDPPPTHRGHSGGFDIVIKNTSPNHAMHIEQGPYPTDLHGDPIDIDLPDMYCTTIPPGGSLRVPGGWEFQDDPPNKAWCDWGASVDPAGVTVEIDNVGNYRSPTDDQTTGGSFEEKITPDCEPTDDGTGCKDVICPEPGEVCVPIVVRHKLPPVSFPPAGIDYLDPTTALVDIQDQTGAGETVVLTGPTIVERQDPYDAGGYNAIQTEIVAMDLTGTSGMGLVTLHIAPAPPPTTGWVIGADDPGTDYPADSFFDVFVTVDIPGMGAVSLHNQEPIPVEALGITDVPPLGSSYETPPGWPGVELFAPDGRPTGLFIRNVIHQLPPAQPEWQVIECDCINPEAQCHIDFAAGAAPSCVGPCPAGELCEQIVTTNPDDGTVEIRCDCVDEATNAFLRVGDWMNPETWHNWIGGSDEVTPVQLHVLDTLGMVSDVDFFYSLDGSYWELFDSDIDGTEPLEYTTGTSPSVGDGWTGYFPHDLVSPYDGPIFFRAEAHTPSGPIIAENQRNYDSTPPSSVSLNVADWEVVETDTLTVDVDPVLADISYVIAYVVKKPEEYKKGIPGISQQPHSTKHCAPTAAAACLKYFETQGDNQVCGGLNDPNLVKALAKRSGTSSTTGTKASNLANGIRGWVKDHGNGYTVRGPLKFKWQKVRDELERSQDVLLGIDWTGGGAHRMTLNSIVNRPKDGKIRLDFMDPWTGTIEYGDLDPATGKLTGFTSTSGNSGKLARPIIVCPKESDPNGGAPPAAPNQPGPDPGPFDVLIPNLGLYSLHIIIVDRTGNAHRLIRIVDRVEPPEACCLPDGTCVDLPPTDCRLRDGRPQGPGTACSGTTIACCLDDGICMDIDPLCCDDLGGTPGYADMCLGDLNGNNIDDACEEPCQCLGDMAASEGQVDLKDLDAMVNLLVAAGPPFIVRCPDVRCYCGDMDSNGQVDLRDLDAMVNMLVAAGPPFIVQCP